MGLVFEDDSGRLVREVLIADSNQARSQRLAEACVEIGMRAATAAHGAAALEIALGKPPDLVVCEADLPLVCGAKLAEILRANPRTNAVRFLFLGPEGGSTSRIEVCDAEVAVSAPREEVMRVIAEQMAKRDRIDALETASQSGDNVDGDLANLPLADLLQVSHLARKSGRVNLERDGDGENIALVGEDATDRLERGFVVLRDGELLQAEIGNVVGEKALFRMLAWREGRFVFDTAGPLEAGGKVLAPVRALVAEGMRQLAEWDRLALELPPLSAMARLSVKTSELPNIVHPLTQEVLLLLEHYDQVREIVDHCSFPDYQVLRTLHTLSQRNIVTIGQAPVRGLAAPSPAEDRLFDEAQLRRLREHLQGGTRRGEPVVSGKILLVACERATLCDWLNLLRSMPSFEASPHLAPGVEPEIELGPLGTLRVDTDLELELVQVPTASSYRPLWPLAAQGALATLFLHGGGVSQAATLDPGLIEILQRGSRRDALHVVLLARKERVCPEELRENLDLLDDASLFLIPLESDKEPSALLRSLVARVVP